MALNHYKFLNQKEKKKKAIGTPVLYSVLEGDTICSKLSAEPECECVEKCMKGP